MLKNGIWMLLSTVLRLASGLLVFVVIARKLGAADFGVLMTGFAAAGILAIPVNYGLSVFMLNEAAKAEDRGARLLAQAFGLRLLLLAAFAIAIWPAALWLKLPLYLVALLFVMHVIEACTELICVRQRANGNFDQETKFVTSQSIFQFVLIASIAYHFKSLGWVALAFVLSRVVSFTMAVVKFRPFAGGQGLVLAGSTKLARVAVPFFLDFSAQSVLVQIDAVLLGHFAGPSAVGTYQAGMRVVQGLSQVITVMVNVALPRLARRQLTAPIGWSLALKVWAVFAVVGMVLAGPLMLWAAQLAHLLFGQAFMGLAPVLEVLGIFVVIRFAAAGSGMLLIAMGEQGMRAAVMVAATLVLAVLAYFLMAAKGAVGAAYAVVGAYAFILISFTGLMLVRLCQRVAVS